MSKLFRLAAGHRGEITATQIRSKVRKEKQSPRPEKVQTKPGAPGNTSDKTLLAFRFP
jgi:hypothetical protein